MNHRQIFKNPIIEEQSRTGEASFALIKNNFDLPTEHYTLY